MFPKRIAAAGLVALGLVAIAVPASAGSFSVAIGSGPIAVSDDGRTRGYYGWGHHRGRQDTLSPQQVRQALRQHGFRNIKYVDRRGSIYQAEATDYRGMRMGLVISARNGAVLNAYRIR